eukprot:scaffold50383_cov35-Tisochrysis_lutea.AAC.2
MSWQQAIWGWRSARAWRPHVIDIVFINRRSAQASSGWRCANTRIWPQLGPRGDRCRSRNASTLPTRGPLELTLCAPMHADSQANPIV